MTLQIRGRLHHDLDDLFGAWSAEEEEDFRRNIEARAIEEDLWHLK
jgi:hypothetical protein